MPGSEFCAGGGWLDTSFFTALPAQQAVLFHLLPRACLANPHVGVLSSSHARTTTLTFFLLISLLLRLYVHCCTFPTPRTLRGLRASAVMAKSARIRLQFHSFGSTSSALMLLAVAVIVAATGAALAATPTPEAAPPPTAPPPNISQVIDGAGQFGTFLSLISATSVGDVFQAQANKTTTGISIFAPTDKAFSSLEAGVISKLTAQEKITLLEFHALSAFYPLSALQQAADPVIPTLATDHAGAGKFTINITNQQGTVVISTGLSKAALISTLYNTLPCGIFAINQVLLPEEIFGRPSPVPSPAPSPAPSPFSGVSPTSSFPPLASISSSPAMPFGPGFAKNPPLSPSSGQSPEGSHSPPSLPPSTLSTVSSLVILAVFNYFFL